MPTILRNQITYTTATTDAGRTIRLEQQATIDRPSRLTRRGAERLLRAQQGNRSLVVSRVETLIYS